MRFALSLGVDSPATLSRVLDSVYDLRGSVSVLVWDREGVWNNKARPQSPPPRSEAPESPHEPPSHEADPGPKKAKRRLLLPQVLLRLKWDTRYTDDQIKRIATDVGYVEPHRVPDDLLQSGRTRRLEDGTLTLTGTRVPIAALGHRWSKKWAALCESFTIGQTYTYDEIITRASRVGYTSAYVLEVLDQPGLFKPAGEDLWVWGQDEVIHA